MQAPIKSKLLHAKHIEANSAYPGRNEMTAVLQTTLQINLLELKSPFLIQISLKFAPGGSIYNTSSLDKVMTWDFEKR